MKNFQVSEDIVSLSDFKDQASKMLLQVQHSQRPIIITQNGRPAGVLISPAEFDLFSERRRFLQAVQSGLDDVAQGQVVADKDLDKVLDEASMV
ncbi:MAG: type II toxin-antitoxin system Phd/YefM family antitoxin [Desulfurivibrio sp.]|nr:type II toxin-antitoxin system Phd/YefM family antitoxin [Desulfurivibrio sp.]